MNRGAEPGFSWVDEPAGGGWLVGFPDLVVCSVAARALSTWSAPQAPAPAGWRYRPSLMGRREGGTWLVEGGWKAGRQWDAYLAPLLEPSPLQSVVHRLIEEQAADARRRGLL